MISVKHI